MGITDINSINTEIAELRGQIAYLETAVYKSQQAEEQLKKIQFDINKRNESLEAINTVAGRIYLSLDYATVAAEAIKAMIHYGRTQTVSMYEYDEAADCLYLMGSSDAFEKMESRRISQKLPMKGSLTSYTINEKKIIFSADMRKDKRIKPDIRDALVKEGKIGVLSIPLLFRDRALGAMNLFFSEIVTFNDYELSTLLSIGKTIGLAMANARYIEQIKEEMEERQRAQRALSQSEEKYRLLIENSSDAIFIVREGKITYANPKALQLSGRTYAELAELAMEKLITAEEKEGEGEGKTAAGQSYTMLNKAGEGLTLEINIVEIKWEGRDARIYFAHDVTAQKKMEAQFYQAQKMEAIGVLAGGIAHDFNNLLMGIQGNASLMLLSLPPEHPHYEKLKNIEHYSRSGAELTSHLLGYARGGKYEVRPLNLNELISRSAAMFGRTKKEIKIEETLAPDLCLVEADFGQIEQVFLNLYINAWQAMPGGGQLYLGTDNIEVDNEYAVLHNIKPGRYARASVTDTGSGMDEETKRGIFVPFFTTKERSRGTGLGLASAYGIIKNHGGTINFYSEKGKGTTFNIYLPASARTDVYPKGKLPAAETALARGSGTILLVDDEEMIINVGKDMLEAMGYRVLTATRGEEAVRIFDRDKDIINLVILDLILPDIGGEVIFNKLREIKPDVRVLLSSGYSINGQAAELLKAGCRGFIQKPYNMKALAARLKNILE